MSFDVGDTGLQWFYNFWELIQICKKTHQTLWNWLKHHLKRTTKLFTIVFLYIFLKYIRSSIHLVISIESSNNVHFYCKVNFFLLGCTFLHDFLEVGLIDYQSEKLWIEWPALVIVYSFFLLNTFYKNINKKWELKNIHETWHTKNLKHFSEWSWPSLSMNMYFS